MPYNLSKFDNNTDYVEVMDNVNDLSGDRLGITIMFLFFIAIFTILRTRYDTIVAFIGSGLSTTLVCAVLMWLGWLSWFYTLIPLTIFIVSLLAYFIQD